MKSIHEKIIEVASKKYNNNITLDEFTTCINTLSVESIYSREDIESIINHFTSIMTNFSNNIVNSFGRHFYPLAYKKTKKYNLVNLPLNRKQKRDIKFKRTKSKSF